MRSNTAPCDYENLILPTQEAGASDLQGILEKFADHFTPVVHGDLPGLAFDCRGSGHRGTSRYTLHFCRSELDREQLS